MSKYLELVEGDFTQEHFDKKKNQNPYVAYNIEDDAVIYTIVPNYLCLKPLDGNNQLALVKMGDYSNIQYSFDRSIWHYFPTDPTNPLNLTYISVDKPIYLRGNNPNGLLTQSGEGCKLISSGKYNVSGDATTLLSEVGGVRDLTPYGGQSLLNLFGSIHVRISGQPIDIPSIDVVDASELILPPITLSYNCYAAMFRDCTSLVAAPKLPATTLSGMCYESMFYNCASLTAAPELPATMLVDSCYSNMFSNCTSLTTAPALPATTLAIYCYCGMFGRCTSLTTVPNSLPAATLAEGCYSRMFEGCISLTTAPELLATTLDFICYSEMFLDCTSLTTAPALPATTLTAGCYSRMFDGCTSLMTAPNLSATTLSDGCYEYMFSGCASLTKAPELPATTLAYRCYQYMFSNCTNLNYIKCLATDISATDCTTDWVQGVNPTGTFIMDPDMNDWTIGVNGIPTGWTEENVVL